MIRAYKYERRSLYSTVYTVCCVCAYYTPSIYLYLYCRYVIHACDTSIGRYFTHF